MRFLRADLLSGYSIHRPITCALLGLSFLSWTTRAAAFPRLEEFLAGARNSAADVREAEYVAIEREADVLSTSGRLLPSLSVSGTYTYNQFDSVMNNGTSEGIVLQPHNVLSGAAQLTVPLIDVQAWKQHASARREFSAAEKSTEVTRLEVGRRIVQYYFSLIGAEALRKAYAESLVAAEETLSISQTKRDEGAATDLDVARAAADVERARQNVASQEYAVAIARRALTTLSGIKAEGDVPALDDDLREEEPLEAWESRLGDDLPSIAAAAEHRTAAEQQVDAAKLAFVPTLSAQVREDVTSSAGMLGHEVYLTAGLSLSWQFDVSMLGDARGKEGALGAARVQEERARQEAQDAVHEAWQSVRTGIARSRAARSETEQALAAVDAANERYTAGSGTQLDLIQARRDLTSAEASRIQADADLSYARVALRLAAGELSEGGAR